MKLHREGSICLKILTLLHEILYKYLLLCVFLIPRGADTYWNVSTANYRCKADHFLARYRFGLNCALRFEKKRINFVGKGCPFFVVYFCFVHMIHLYGYTCLVLKRVANRPSFQECNYEIFDVVCFIVVSVCVDTDDSVP